MHFSADELSFKNLVYTPNAHTVVIELDNGDKVSAVMQDIQFHPVTDSIPVRLEGNSPGVRNGGRLLFRKRKLVIRALPANLPDFFNVDISKLKIGDNISVESLKSEDFTILHPDSTVVVQVKTARTAVMVEEDEDELEEGAEEGAEAPAAEAPAEATEE